MDSLHVVERQRKGNTGEKHTIQSKPNIRRLECSHYSVLCIQCHKEMINTLSVLALPVVSRGGPHTTHR